MPMFFQRVRDTASAARCERPLWLCFGVLSLALHGLTLALLFASRSPKSPMLERSCVSPADSLAEVRVGSEALPRRYRRRRPSQQLRRARMQMYALT